MKTIDTLKTLVQRDPDTLSSSEAAFMDKSLPVAVALIAVAGFILVNLLLMVMGVKA